MVKLKPSEPTGDELLEAYALEDISLNTYRTGRRRGLNHAQTLELMRIPNMRIVAYARGLEMGITHADMMKGFDKMPLAEFVDLVGKHFATPDQAIESHVAGVRVDYYARARKVMSHEQVLELYSRFGRNLVDLMCFVSLRRNLSYDAALRLVDQYEDYLREIATIVESGGSIDEAKMVLALPDGGLKIRLYARLISVCYRYGLGISHVEAMEVLDRFTFEFPMGLNRYIKQRNARRSHQEALTLCSS